MPKAIEQWLLFRYIDTTVGPWSGISPDESSLLLLDQSTEEVYALDLEAQ
jgi:hypothetical protein